MSDPSPLPGRRPIDLSPTSAPSLRTCEAHNLRYDPTRADGCVLCRRPTTEPPRPKARAGFILIGVAVAFLALTSVASLRFLLPPPAPAHRVLRLHTTNSAGRSGAYYLPTRSSAARSTPLPLLVFLHGTGGDGDSGIQAFRPLADERGFAILTPESGVAPDGRITWEVGDAPRDLTNDRRHVMACLAEILSVLSSEGLTLDANHVLLAGHSGGASSAPYIATNEEPFTAFAVLHGGAFPGGFGHRRVRGWFSTGSVDPIRPPDMVTRAYDAARGPGTQFQMRVFPNGHELGHEELRALIAWWLDP